LLLLDNQNITTQKHSRTQRLHSTNILYNYSMMTSCCKVSERKATKSICIWTVGWVVWKPPINYLPIEDLTLLYIKNTPQYFLSAFGRHPIIHDTNKANYR
jgi:hypothetical protein